MAELQGRVTRQPAFFCHPFGRCKFKERQKWHTIVSNSQLAEDLIYTAVRGKIDKVEIIKEWWDEKDRNLYKVYLKALDRGNGSLCSETIRGCAENIAGLMQDYEAFAQYLPMIRK